MNLFFSRPLLIGGCYYAVFIILFFFNIIFNTEKMNCSLQYWVGKLDVFRPLTRFHFIKILDFSFQVCQSTPWLPSWPLTPSPSTTCLRTRRGADLPRELWSSRCSTLCFSWSSTLGKYQLFLLSPFICIQSLSALIFCLLKLNWCLESFYWYIFLNYCMLGVRWNLNCCQAPDPGLDIPGPQPGQPGQT